MKKNTNIVLIIFIILLFLIGCSKFSNRKAELASFPLNNLENVITQSVVKIDKKISNDGRGSLKITVDNPTTIRLFEVKDINVENARLNYEAKMRTENLKGQAYLEMWCYFPGKGEFFSRDLQTPLTGTNNWTTEQTSFFLRKNEKPKNIKLNVVINGTGTVWIDEIKLIKIPFQ